MHTDVTLGRLSQVTKSLGDKLRSFQGKTCPAFPARELERERAARLRRQAPGLATVKSGTSNPKAQKHSSSARQPKQLNLRTYTFHSLGDYHLTIRRFGTTDSYTTQPVSLS
jgi:hypothetical protein